MADLIQIRRDTQDNWESANPTLALGEIGIITDNNTSESTSSVSLKVGDGHSSWGQLPEQVFIKPDTLDNISASIAAVQTGSSAELNQVSASLNSRITSVSSSISGTVSGVRSDLTSATSSLSGSIAQVSASQVALSGSFSSSLAGVSSQLDGKIDDVSSSIVQTMKDEYALQDGYYSQMSVGLAENLISPDGVTNTEPYIFRPSAGSTSIGTGYATLQKMEGHTVKFNQLLNVPNGGTVSGPAGYYGEIVRGAITKTPIVGHKYYLSVFINRQVTSTNNISINFGSSTATGSGNLRIIVTSSTPNNDVVSTVTECTSTPSESIIYYNNYASSSAGGLVEGDYITITNPMMIDLTLLGIDNFTTADQVEAWLTKNVGYQDYYDYTTGKLVSVDVDGLKTVGFNQWDEEWEGGSISSSTGQKEPNASNFRTKNYIRIFPATDYYIKVPTTTGIRFYDMNKTFLGQSTNKVVGGGNTMLITTPANAYYMMFVVIGRTTYSNDICINLSWSGYRNGEYEPYWTETLDLSWIKSLTYTPSGGTETQMFPYGLLSAGSVKDEITATKAIKRVGAVNLGNLNWSYNTDYTWFYSYLGSVKTPNSNSTLANIICGIYKTVTKGNLTITDMSSAIDTSNYLIIKNSAYNNSSTFRTAMNGVMLYYELATPIEIDITPAKNLNYKVDDFGTEEFVSSATSVPQTAAPNHTTHYMDNLRDKLRNIDNNFVAATQEQSFTDLEKAQARRNIGAGTVNPQDKCPDMEVGLAGNLSGRKVVEAEYTFRKSDNNSGSGTAQIDTIKGKTLKWQQMVQNGNFSNGDNNWSYFGSNLTTTVSNNVLSVTSPTGQAYFGTITTINGLVEGHKYYIVMNVKSSVSTTVYNIYYSGFSRIDPSGDYKNLAANTWTLLEGIFTKNSSIDKTIGLRHYYNDYGSEVTLSLKNVMCIDLTAFYGSGNEPNTVVQFGNSFKPLYPLDYYAYTSTPVLINNAASGIKTTGFNQWDEQWELGNINPADGATSADNTRIRCKNFIPVFGSQTYYFYNGSNSEMALFAYDASYNYIGCYVSGSFIVSSGGTTSNIRGLAITLPSNCAYIKFRCVSGYGTTYKNDICINISWSGYRNGEYEPYEEHTLYFNGESGSLATITGKKLVDGVPTGESVTIFPEGMKSVGTVYDFGKADSDGYIRKVTKKLKVLDLGAQSWTYSSWSTGHEEMYTPDISDIKAVANTGLKANMICPMYETTTANLVYTHAVDKTIALSGTSIRVYDSSYTNASTFKTAMSGVKIYIELATPEEYLLDTPIPANYIFNNYGTEARLPSDTSSTVKAPIRYDVKYPINAADTLLNLPKDYISAGSMTNFTTELASKLGTFLSASIAISSSYNATNQEYNYSITITRNA